MQIDSDKYMALAMCAVLAGSVWGVTASLLQLAAQEPWPHSNNGINYFALLVFSLWAVGGLLDREFRRTNGYGLGGLCCFAAGFALRLFMPGALEGFWAIPIVLELVAFALWLIESVRWLRSRVSWAPISQQGKDSAANRCEKGE